ncbi:hypothetical protein BD626DRAFT_583091 [Schizophyllum amplum]|uniref:Fungal-type protein kinase domain-containing protein n=1 Tax=Schizophyllum amplum TaxID=97359 RepID=A0A550CIR3_9AGAR|nr:hypothetical protein BD626DRAFT_583091 [Auriculariopsis ampla]
MAQDNYGAWAGPFPFDEFLDEFVPAADTRTPDVQYDIKDPKKEKDMYPKLLKGMNSVMRRCVTIDTSHQPDRRAPAGKKKMPDFLAYASAIIDLERGSTQLNEALLGGEEKLDEDPFDDNAEDGAFEPELGTKKSETVGQILRYIEEMHASQHRVFSFFLFLNFNYFRVIRADKDGLIVTDKRMWRQDDPKLKYQCLNEFLHRFDNLSPEAQGFDTTVRAVSEENAAHKRRAKKELFPYINQDKLSLSTAVREMDVPCAEAPTGFRTFYVWASSGTDTRGLRSRATRGYPAWDPQDKRVVFIKDGWRSNVGQVVPEAERIKYLNARGVDHVPKLVCGGDIPGQKTVTHLYVDRKWNKGQRKKHHPRAHHRLVENIGLPLWKFKSSKHLMQILFDALTGHQQAVELCRTLHRDFSPRNIFWDEETGRGFLADWDLCAPMPELPCTDPDVNPMAQKPNSSGRPDRTGTWGFMSSLSLSEDDKLHDVQDDLESLFWVGFYMILLYFPFNIADVIHIVDTVYYQAEFKQDEEKKPVGGKNKWAFLWGLEYDSVFSFHDTISRPLEEWADAYRRLLRDWGQYYAELKQWRKDQGTARATKRRARQNKPTAPDLRNYDALMDDWKELLETGEFQDNDRLNDPLHEQHPEAIIEAYRKQLKKDSKADRIATATQKKLNSDNMCASSSFSATLQGTPLEEDEDEEAASGSRADAEHDEEAGSGEDDDEEVAEDVDEVEENEEEIRAAKRQKTAAPGTYIRTSSPTQLSGRKGKGRL